MEIYQTVYLIIYELSQTIEIAVSTAIKNGFSQCIVVIVIYLFYKKS